MPRTRRAAANISRTRYFLGRTVQRRVDNKSEASLEQTGSLAPSRRPLQTAVAPQGPYAWFSVRAFLSWSGILARRRLSIGAASRSARFPSSSSHFRRLRCLKSSRPASETQTTPFSMKARPSRIKTITSGPRRTALSWHPPPSRSRMSKAIWLGVVSSPRNVIKRLDVPASMAPREIRQAFKESK